MWAFDPVSSGLGPSFQRGQLDSDRGGTQVQVLELSLSHKDVSGLEAYLLGTLHEAIDTMVHREMLDQPDSQGRALEATW